MKKIVLLLAVAGFFKVSNAQTPAWLWAETETSASGYIWGVGIWASPSGSVYMDGRSGGMTLYGPQTITSSNSSQIYSGKMNSAGTFSWLTFHPTYAPGGTDYCYGFGWDNYGDTYTTGLINSGTGIYADAYDSNGVEKWSVPFYPVGNNMQGGGFQITADKAKNAYLTGGYEGTITFGSTTLTATGHNDMFLTKIDSNGNCKWAVDAGPNDVTLSLNDGGRGVAVDQAGNIYVCGSYTGTTSFGNSITLPTTNTNNFFIAKYDTAGNPLWVATATNAGFVGTQDPFWWTYEGLAIDSCSNIYVTGHFINTAQFGPSLSVTNNGGTNAFIAKCNANGTWEWVQSVGGTSGNDDGDAITLDKYSDVYVTGIFQNTATFGNQAVSTSAYSDIFVAKYANSNGALQWVQTATGSDGSNYTNGRGITVDKQGFTYVSGLIGSGTDVAFSTSAISGTDGFSQNVLIAKLDTVAPRYIVPTVSKNYCPGETVALPYTVTGKFDTGNTFTAQLSNDSGSFINPKFLGNTLSDTSGTITITIPANIPAGSTYLIRVVSDSPTTSSWANGCGYYFKNAVYINDFYVSIGNNLSVSVIPAMDTICPGGSVKLSAFASGATTYTWSNLATTDTTTVNPTKDTTYYVSVSNGTCSGVDSVKIKIDSAPALIILPQPPPLFCSGSSAELKVKGGGTNFIWTPVTGLSDTTNSDSVLASPTVTTTYKVTGNDSLGCATSGTEKVTVFPAPIIPTFTQYGDTLKSSAQYQNQWYLNGTLLVGDTSQYLTITTGGEYWVSVTNEANGCSSASDSASIKLAGINQVSAISDQVSIYPNPFNNTIVIKINSSAVDIKDWNLQIIDVLGRTVYSRSALNYSNAIDLSNLAGGIYFITVINKTGRVVVPVVREN